MNLSCWEEEFSNSVIRPFGLQIWISPPDSPFLVKRHRQPKAILNLIRSHLGSFLPIPLFGACLISIFNYTSFKEETKHRGRHKRTKPTTESMDERGKEKAVVELLCIRTFRHSHWFSLKNEPVVQSRYFLQPHRHATGSQSFVSDCCVITRRTHRSDMAVDDMSALITRLAEAMNHNGTTWKMTRKGKRGRN